jgi:hypothetical protein
VAGLQIITAPQADPLSYADAVAQLRLDNSEEVDLVGGYISAAAAYCSDYLRRQLVQATYRLSLDGFPGQCEWAWGEPSVIPTPKLDDPAIVLPNPPLQRVLSITYVDTSGQMQTLSPTAYYVDDQTEPARIMPAAGTSWPSALNQVNAVSVVYTAGWMVPVSLATDGTVSFADANVSEGDGFKLYGSLPGSLSPSTTYYAINVTDTQCNLARTPSGSGLSFNGTGSGVMLDRMPSVIRQAIRVLVTHFYENRGNSDTEVPAAVNSLLGGHRVWRF